MRLSTVAGSIQILVTGLIAGIFVAIVATGPARLSLEITNFVRHQQDLHEVFGTMMPPFAMASIFVGLVWMVLLRKRFKSAAFLLAALSTFCAIAALVVSFRLNFPLNDVLITWNAASPPANAKELWLSWEHAHVVRTGIYLVSFISATAASNLSRTEI